MLGVFLQTKPLLFHWPRKHQRNKIWLGPSGPIIAVNQQSFLDWACVDASSSQCLHSSVFSQSLTHLSLSSRVSSRCYSNVDTNPGQSRRTARRWAASLSVSQSELLFWLSSFWRHFSLEAFYVIKVRCCVAFLFSMQPVTSMPLVRKWPHVVVVLFHGKMQIIFWWHISFVHNFVVKFLVTSNFVLQFVLF